MLLRSKKGRLFDSPRFQLYKILKYLLPEPAVNGIIIRIPYLTVLKACSIPADAIRHLLCIIAVGHQNGRECIVYHEEIQIRLHFAGYFPFLLICRLCFILKAFPISLLLSPYPLPLPYSPSFPKIMPMHFPEPEPYSSHTNFFSFSSWAAFLKYLFYSIQHFLTFPFFIFTPLSALHFSTYQSCSILLFCKNVSYFLFIIINSH